jgi:uncharacterized protein YegJ (DUF2314 family)
VFSSINRGQTKLSTSTTHTMKDRVFNTPSKDLEIDKASINARKSFKIFWRELSWEMRRIIPAHRLCAVKRAFPTKKNKKGDVFVEHMWVGDITFDGRIISGELLNQPDEIEDINQGDLVRFHYEEISDWMYSIGEKVYGAFTVNVIRTRMTEEELKENDNAWGINFGDPSNIHIEEMLSFDEFLITQSSELPEHPMSKNMVVNSEAGIREMGTRINDPSVFGMTMLQFESLAGNLAQVKLLLKYGADKRIKNVHGQTAQDLAEMFNWSEILAVLK